MIQFNSTITQLLQEPVIESFILIKFKKPSSNEYYRETSYIYDLTLDNSEIYYSYGRILSFDPPKLSTSVDREQYKLAFADTSMYFGEYADEGLVGLPIEVRIGFVDTTNNTPLTQLENTLLIYKGQIDNGSYAINTNEVGESIFNISCTSPMSDLDLTKVFYTSKEFLKKLNPEDTSFDQIYEGSGQLELKWGRV